MSKQQVKHVEYVMRYCPHCRKATDQAKFEIKMTKPYRKSYIFECVECGKTDK